MNIKDNEPKWKTICRVLQGELTDGMFHSGDRFYTIRELCRRFGVSDMTARRVFRQLRSEGFVVSSGRRGTIITAGGATRTVFVCLRTEYLAGDGDSWIARYRTIQQFMEGLQHADLGCLFEFHAISLDFAIQNPETIAKSPVLVSAEALLEVASDRVALNRPLLERLVAHVNPIVFQSFGGIPGVTQVGTDLAAGTRAMVGHLDGHVEYRKHEEIVGSPPKCLLPRPRPALGTPRPHRTAESMNMSKDGSCFHADIKDKRMRDKVQKS